MLSEGIPSWAVIGATLLVALVAFGLTGLTPKQAAATLREYYRVHTEILARGREIEQQKEAEKAEKRQNQRRIAHSGGGSRKKRRGGGGKKGSGGGGGSGGSGGGGGGALEEALEKKPTKVVTFARLMQEMAFVEWRWVIPAAAVSFTLTGLNLLSPNMNGRIFDALVSDDDTDRVSVRSLVTYRVLLMGAMFVAKVAYKMLFNMARWRMSLQARERLYRQILRQDMGFFEASKAGELSSRLRSEPSRVQDLFTNSGQKILNSVCTLTGTAIYIAYVDWRFLLIGVVVRAPVMAYIVKGASKIQGFYAKVANSIMADANAMANEAMANAATVHDFCSHESEIRGYQAKIIEYLEIRKQTVFSTTVMQLSQFFVDNITQICLMAFAVNEISAGRITLGTYIGIRHYVSSCRSAGNVLVNFYNDFAKLQDSCERFFELMDRVPDVPLTGGALLAKPLAGDIEIRNLRFSYPLRPEVEVIKGMSIRVAPGEVLALVGSSGSGKSTVFRLLKRFYQVPAGTIFFDGRDVTELDTNWLRSHIGVVSQDCALFDRSIAANIAYGLDGVTQDEIEAAAVAANIHDFVCSLPDGYETSVGERGVSLSGGQVQRIAIARAIVRNPRILLLDEATASLDSINEHKIQTALTNLMQGRTSIIIAHRLSTVTHADHIAVISDGTVAEYGTHAELMAADGQYRRFVETQIIPLADLEAFSSGDDRSSEAGATGDVAELDGASDTSASPDAST